MCIFDVEHIKVENERLSNFQKDHWPSIFHPSMYVCVTAPKEHSARTIFCRDRFNVKVSLCESPTQTERVVVSGGYRGPSAKTQISIAPHSKSRSERAHLCQTESCKQGWGTYPKSHHQRRQKKHTGTFRNSCFKEAKPYNYIIGALCVPLPASKKGIPSKLRGVEGTYKNGLGRLPSERHTLASSPPCLSKSCQQLATIKGRSCGDLTCSQSLHLQSSWGGIIHSKSSRTP